MTCCDPVSSDNPVEILQGANLTLELTVLDENGLAVDLTGARVLVTVKTRLADKQPLLTKDSSVSGDVEFTAPRSGTARIYFFPRDTATMTARSYVYDVWVYLANGKHYAVIPPSELTVLSAVTRGF